MLMFWIVVLTHHKAIMLLLCNGGHKTRDMSFHLDMQKSTSNSLILWKPQISWLHSNSLTFSYFSAWCWFSGWFGILGSWVWAQFAAEFIPGGVDSACHPSEISEMSTGELAERHSISGRFEPQQNDSYLAAKLPDARRRSYFPFTCAMEDANLNFPWLFISKIKPVDLRLN